VDCNFTLRHYTEIIEAYQAAGYAVVSTRDYLKNKPGRYVVMRHDLDIAIDRALAMSAIELGQRCTATYFMRLHARYYNLLSDDSIKILKSILSAGHEIGLHLEPGMVERLAVPIEVYLAQVRAFLSGILDTPLTTLSQHYAGTRLVELSPACWLDGWYDITNQKAMGNAKYLSDSGGRWREGCLCKWLGKVDGIHVTTHPIWWYYVIPQENF
jgi:hypothetical protein